TLPLLIVRGLGARRSGLAGKNGTTPLAPSLKPQASSHEPQAPSLEPLAPSPTALVATALMSAAGVAAWFIPLVAISGGPAAYWRALSNQGAEDLGNITMLWTRHDLRTVADALYYALVAPWATWAVAAIVLVCAAAGIASLWRANRTALALVVVAFGPYFVFDLLFQETFTS